MAGRTFQRSPPRRTIGRKIIIACEGEKTERGYFEAMRQSLRISKDQVKVLKTEGSDPLTVVQAALDEREAQYDDQSWYKGSTAWAVFDGDEHIAHNPDNWQQALLLAQRKSINLAISNPCFELWYLLHYQEQTASLHRDQARHRLRRHIPEYDKPDILYPTIKNLTDQAVQRSSLLDHHIMLNGQPFYTNPCSGVWRLVETLRHLK